MSNTVNFAVVGVPPLVAGAVAWVTEASPLEYGIVGLVLTVGLLPIIKWMTRRMDIAQQADIAAAKIRSDRDENHLIQLTKLVTNIETLNGNHQAMHSTLVRRLEDISIKLERLDK